MDRTDEWDQREARHRVIVQTEPGKFEARDKGYSVIRESQETGRMEVVTVPPRDPHAFTIPVPVIGKFFRHYKTGGVYQVMAVAAHSESLEPMVVYREEGTDKHWVRPAKMWFDWIVTERGREQRFRLCDPDGEYL